VFVYVIYNCNGCEIAVFGLIKMAGLFIYGLGVGWRSWVRVA
jgi:hypothetical protein